MKRVAGTQDGVNSLCGLAMMAGSVRALEGLRAFQPKNGQS